MILRNSQIAMSLTLPSSLLAGCSSEYHQSHRRLHIVYRIQNIICMHTTHARWTTPNGHGGGEALEMTDIIPEIKKLLQPVYKRTSGLVTLVEGRQMEKTKEACYPIHSIFPLTFSRPGRSLVDGEELASTCAQVHGLLLHAIGGWSCHLQLLT
ncbi:hypothetical protein BC939DRAFT_438826 [Gamsiella multidivaricata]|uniref:uncharacterized protein n=1 Tax=Gamsiella multidivaricata TaxID=101098 RepID=UPI00221ED22E|nr:uncharacterized protein BC939DRAFT_438826 [Gamsiella multidivaricata]KAI7830709.1 hypothetical protein BC939DRAFT_438826 [Gamsiella multidivaricata]